MGEIDKARGPPSGVNCQKKLKLLTEEGVVFDAGGCLVDKSSLWDSFVVEK